MRTNTIIDFIYGLLDKILVPLGIGKTDIGSLIMILLGVGMLTGYVSEDNLKWVYDNWERLFITGVGIAGLGISDRMSGGRFERSAKKAS